MGLRCRRARPGRGLEDTALNWRWPSSLKPSPRRHTGRLGNIAAAWPPPTPTFHPRPRSSGLLQPVSISCTNSPGIRGQLGRRTNTQKTFSSGPSRPQENTASRPRRALGGDREDGTGTLTAHYEKGTAGRSASSLLPGSVRAAWLRSGCADPGRASRRPDARRSSFRETLQELQAGSWEWPA